MTSKLFESVCLKINIKNQFYNFIATYKPPSTSNEIFLDNLQSYLLHLDPVHPLFIIGDLNMDLKSSKGIDLTNFMIFNNMINYVDDYTRIVSRYSAKQNKFINSKSLLDVVLHNSNLILETASINCPFSDHNFVVVKVDRVKVKSKQRSILTRNLSLINLGLIEYQLNTITWTNMGPLSIENHWTLIRDSILKITNSKAPLKNINLSYKSKFPWSDQELHHLKQQRDKSFKVFKVYPNYDTQIKYKTSCSIYQKEKRIKMINYFKDNSKITDFKNAKNYWKFCSSSINIKSTKSYNNEHIILENNDIVMTSPDQIVESFNTFFTSLSSHSTCEQELSLAQITKNYEELKLNGFINTGYFEFKPTSILVIKRLLANLNDSSSPGCAGIPTKVIKHCDNLAYIMLNIINKCMRKHDPNRLENCCSDTFI